MSRRTISVGLLVTACLLFYVVLLTLATSPSGAQGGTTGGGNTTINEVTDEITEENIIEENIIEENQPGSCPDPQLVGIIQDNQSQITPPFPITGEEFRISFEADPIRPRVFGPGFFGLDPLDDNGSLLPFNTFDQLDFGNQESLIGDEVVPQGPGFFSLQIQADNVQYLITIEDCTGTAPDNQGPGNDVIRNTIPNKPLPPTGGGWPVYGMVAAFVLTGAGLLGLGFGIRRRQ